MTRVPALLRLLALTTALFVTTIVIAGWWLADSASRLGDTENVSLAALDTVDQTIDATARITNSVLDGLQSVEDLGPALTASSAATGTLIEEVSVLTGQRLAESIGAIESSLPAMIEAAAVMDNSLRALSLVGVAYDPPVPLDDGLRQLQIGIDGLPAELETQGERLMELSGHVDEVTAQVATVTATVRATAAELRTASQLFDSYRSVVDGARQTVDGGAWGAAVTAIRVVILVGGAAGFSMAWAAWQLAEAISPRRRVLRRQVAVK